MYPRCYLCDVVTQWSLFLVDLLLNACHYIICYEVHIPLIFALVSSLSWMLWTWWLSLCNLMSIFHLLDPLIIVLYALGKRLRSLSFVVFSAVLLLAKTKFVQDNSLPLLVAICYAIDHSFHFSSWFAVICVFIWENCWLQTAVLLGVILSQWLGKGLSHVRLFSAFLYAVMHFSLPSAFSFSQLTQLLSLLICVESLSLSLSEVSIVAALLFSWSNSPLSGMMHIISLVEAMCSARRRIHRMRDRESMMHFVILFSIAILGLVEMAREHAVMTTVAKHGCLWPLTGVIRRDVRELRTFVESRTLWHDLFSLAAPLRGLGQVGEKELLRCFLAGEEGSAMFQNFPFSHLLLSPFDKLTVSCEDNNPCLYCLLKNCTMGTLTYGLQLDTLSSFRLIYESEDSLFLVYSIVQ